MLTSSPIQVRKSIIDFSGNLENLISAHQILSFCCLEWTSHMSEHILYIFRTQRLKGKFNDGDDRQRG